MPFLAGRRLFDSSGETGAVQNLPVLAGAGGRQTRVAQDSGLVSGNRKGRISADRNSGRVGAGDARSLPVYVRLTNHSPVSTPRNLTPNEAVVRKGISRGAGASQNIVPSLLGPSTVTGNSATSPRSPANTGSS